jgi:metal-responsive CopG/Arc/MetJ family transcriptional regulator
MMVIEASFLERLMTQTTRTTVALPKALLEGIDDVIEAGRASSRNEFLAAAIRRELKRIQREAIDAEFAGMEDDEIYRDECLRIASEYEHSDWEALRVAEDDS